MADDMPETDPCGITVNRGVGEPLVRTALSRLLNNSLPSNGSSRGEDGRLRFCAGSYISLSLSRSLSLQSSIFKLRIREVSSIGKSSSSRSKLACVEASSGTEPLLLRWVRGRGERSKSLGSVAMGERYS